jgi:cell division protease FtsH
MGPLQWILIVGGLLLLISLVMPRGGGTPEIGIGRVLDMAESGQLALIEVDGDELGITTLSDETFRSRKEAGVSVLELLEERGVAAGAGGVQIEVKKESVGLFSILISLLPIVFIAGIVIFMLRRSQGGINQAMRLGKARARQVGDNGPSVTFDDVAGADEAKQELVEVVEFLSTPEKFTKLGAKIPKGILLIGPPGTGKTLISRAVAGEAKVPFFTTSGSEFVEMFVGVGASRVRDLFAKARESAPAVIFIDEIDAVGRHRGAGVGGGNDEREQTLNQILVEMDGFDERTNVIVIAATNRPDILDPALIRPGRFDRRVVVEAPDVSGREAILAVHLKGKPVAQVIDLRSVARETPGFTGADLANLVNEAAILAAREERTEIGQGEFEEAIERVIAGPAKKSRRISEHERKVVAYHEAGHALVAAQIPEADPVHKVTIVARGAMGGHTRLLPEEDRMLWTKGQFEAMLAVMMGGQAAEQVVFGDVTTGASNDLLNATNLARKMVTEYGMSTQLGSQTFDNAQDQVFLGKALARTRGYSEAVAEKIDAEVSRLLKAARDRASTAIGASRDSLARVAEKLLADETIQGPELATLLSAPTGEAEPAA